MSDELLTPADAADLYPALARLRRDAPVYWSAWWAGWVISRHADVTAGFRDPRLSADRAGHSTGRLPEATRKLLEPLTRNLAGWALISDPPTHTRLRGLVNKAFTPRLSEQLRPQIQALADRLLDEARGADEVDLIAALANPLPVAVIGAMLGLPAADSPRLKGWSDAIAHFLGAAAPTPQSAGAALRCVLELEDYFRGVIAERRRSPGDDLISGLLAAEEQGELLSEQELLSTCTMVLFGGHETTTNLIGNAVHQLLAHPDQLARLQAEPARLPAAIEEVMRYDAPVTRMGRIVKEDHALHGQPLRRGERVWLALAAANRDERQFADPDRFDITRTDHRHVGFGVGSHYCVGAALGRLEAQIAVGTLLRRFPRLRAAGPPERLDNVTIRGFARLPLALGPEA